MARDGASAGDPLALSDAFTIEALDSAFALEKPADDSQQAAKPDMTIALRTALDARRQRIVISESAVGAVRSGGEISGHCASWSPLHMVHADNRRACAITSDAALQTGVALSALLIAADSRPFTGEISVTPELLKQVIATEAKGDTSR